MQELLDKPWFVVGLVLAAGLGLVVFLRRPAQPAAPVIRQEANLDPIVQQFSQSFQALQAQNEETRQGLLGLFGSQQSSLQQAAQGILSALGETATAQLGALNAGLRAIDQRVIDKFSEQQQFITTNTNQLQQSITQSLQAQQAQQQAAIQALQDRINAQSAINELMIGQNSFLACYDAKVGWRRECLYAKGNLGRTGTADMGNLQAAEQEASRYSQCRRPDKTFDLQCAGRQILGGSLAGSQAGTVRNP